MARREFSAIHVLRHTRPEVMRLVVYKLARQLGRELQQGGSDMGERSEFDTARIILEYVASAEHELGERREARDFSQAERG